MTLRVVKSELSYQSECHCAKTLFFISTNQIQLSYQSECHCAKTDESTRVTMNLLSYQSECHCAKTGLASKISSVLLSYQSECHCAKTVVAKSPLQGDVHSDLIRDNIRAIEQVNHLFVLINIILN